MDEYTHDDKTIFNGNIMMSDTITISSRHFFVYLDIDDHSIMVILDILNGVYAIDLNRNMMFHILNKDEIFAIDEPIQSNSVFAAITEKKKQIHIFIDNQHFSIPISFLMSCLESTVDVNAFSFSTKGKTQYNLT